MMPSGLRKQFLLHSKKSHYQRRVDEALQNIDAFLDVCETPYISVSGGKDSSVLLHLCRRVYSLLDAVHLDLHAAYPETETLLNTYNNLKYVDVGSRLEMLKEQGMHAKGTKGFSDDWMHDAGYDGFFYGLRAEESAARRKLIGKIYYQKKNGVWVCQPLIRWRYEDIWAYIVSEDVKYNALYDLAWDRPKNAQRVACYGLTKAANYGSVAYMKMTHPELFNIIIKYTDKFREFV